MAKKIFMKRSVVILCALIIAAGFIFSLPPKAISAGETVKWNVSVWGGKRAWTKPLHVWADEMDKKTGGRWKIKIHYGGVLAPPKENLDGLRAGMFEAASFCAAYHPGKVPLHTVHELPFIAPDKNIHMFQMVQELWKHPALRKELLIWNAVPLLAGGLCQYHLMGNKPIRTVADLDGARVRMGGDIGKALKSLGAVPTLVPAPETYEALSRGTVDLIGFPYTYAYGAYKIHEVSKYITPVSLGTMNCPFVASKDAWDALPAEFKQYHQAFYEKSPEVWAAEYEKADNKWLPIFHEKLEYIDFPKSERDKIVAKVDEGFYSKWIENWEKKGLPARDVFNYYLIKRRELTGK
jgi:TRAP-type C4-dicarboxylate transport system substrate-binding protein